MKLINKLRNLKLTRKFILPKHQLNAKTYKLAQECKIYSQDPNYNIFLKSLLTEMLSDCDVNVTFKLISDLQKFANKKVNEDWVENIDDVEG